MEILRKELGKGEVNWKGIVIPRDKKSLFPPPGTQFDLSDERTKYRAKIDNQCRIRLALWFRQHPTVKAGDEVVFSEENGVLRLTLSGSGVNRAWSTRELLGKETPRGKLVDVEHSPDGPMAVVQRTERLPLDQLLGELSASRSGR